MRDVILVLLSSSPSVVTLLAVTMLRIERRNNLCLSGRSFATYSNRRQWQLQFWQPTRRKDLLGNAATNLALTFTPTKYCFS